MRFEGEAVFLDRLPYYCIYGCMKTTIDLPDDVLRQAKVIAAQRGTTLKELITQGLLHVTQSVSQDEQKKRRSALKCVVAGLRATNSQPMAPLKRTEIYDR